ncbi:uncharacterized protein LOC144682709 [Cetorhinus maximus]
MEEQEKKVKKLLNDRVQDEVSNLRKEMENLLKDLHTLQDSLRSKFVPLEKYEEKQKKFSISLNKLKKQLAEKTHQCSSFQEAANKYKKETEELKNQLNEVKEALKTKIGELSKRRADNEVFGDSATELRQVEISLERSLADSEVKMKDEIKLCGRKRKTKRKKVPKRQ